MPSHRGRGEPYFHLFTHSESHTASECVECMLSVQCNDPFISSLLE